MTSSAASETDRARKRICGCRLRTCRSTSTPPPPGRWTSRSTRSGCFSPMMCTAPSTSPASPTTSTPSPSSPRTPLRKRRWSSTITTRGTASPSLKLVLSSSTLWTLPTGVRCTVAAVRFRSRGSQLRDAEHTELDLGALPRGGAYAGGTAVALHTAEDGTAHTHAVLGYLLQFETDTAVAYEHQDFLLLDLAEDGDGVGTGVLGSVDHGLTSGPEHGAETVVDVAVTHTHNLDGDTVFLLDLGGHPFQAGPDRGLGVGGALVEPAAQCALLDPGQALDLAGIIGATLDQGEGVQDGVVDVGGEFGTFGVADAFTAFVVAFAHQADDPRSEEHTSELQSRGHLVCRLLLEKKKNCRNNHPCYSNLADKSRTDTPA